MSHRYLKIHKCNVCPNLKTSAYTLPHCNNPKNYLSIIKDLNSIPADCPLETEYDICTQIKTTFADQILEYLFLLPEREPISRLSPEALGVLDSVITMVKQLKEMKNDR